MKKKIVENVNVVNNVFFTADGEEYIVVEVGEVLESGSRFAYNAVVMDTFGHYYEGDICCFNSGEVRCFRPRQRILNFKKDVLRDDLVYVSSKARHLLRKEFGGDVIWLSKKDNIEPVEERYYRSIPGGGFPIVSPDAIVVADFGMNGTGYWVLSLEDAYWFEHQYDIKLAD